MTIATFSWDEWTAPNATADGTAIVEQTREAFQQIGSSVDHMTARIAAAAVCSDTEPTSVSRGVEAAAAPAVQHRAAPQPSRAPCG